MNKLNIFICENFAPEFQRIITSEGFDDVNIKVYCNMCENKQNKADTLKLLQESIVQGDDGLILCNKHCDNQTPPLHSRLSPTQSISHTKSTADIF